MSCTEKVDTELVLIVTEELNEKFADPAWNKLKGMVADHYLFPSARKLIKSKAWMDRYFAIRCMTLVTKREDQNYIADMLKDPVPLIRFAAAKAAVNLNTDTIFDSFFEAMSAELTNARYAYRDAILKGPSENYGWIKEQLKTEVNISKRIIFLDLLTFRSDFNVIDLITSDLTSENGDLRFNAVRVVKKFPSDRSKEILLPFISDSYWKVRAEVMEFLALVAADVAFPILQKGLSDENWWVRLKAGLSLKQFDEKGEKILQEQNSESNKNAYDIAQYVLAIPKGHYL